MNKNKQKGFTLIELLVVIAVIGVLASVIMISVSSTRNKGGDAGIKKSINEARTQAELYFLNNGNKYVSVAGSLTDNVCTAPSTTKNRLNDILTNMASLSKTTLSTTLGTAQAASTAANLSTNLANGTVCHVTANGSAYAISTRLIGSPAQYLCIDSANKNRVTATPLAASATVCP